MNKQLAELWYMVWSRCNMENVSLEVVDLPFYMLPVVCTTDYCEISPTFPTAVRMCQKSTLMTLRSRDKVSKHGSI
jgi:hypothetical protein